MSQTTTFTNLRIWDGIADNYLDANSLTLENGRISAIGSKSKSKNDRDLSGLTVIPGLIDSHVHMVLDPFIFSVQEQLEQSASLIRDKMSQRALKMVQHGITTARDLGGGDWLELELRDRINRREIAGPRLLCSGRPITSVGGHCFFWNGEAADETAAKQVIDSNHKRNVDLIKVMATGGNFTKQSSPGRAQFSELELSSIVQYANQFGYHVAAHCHGTEGIRNATRAGVKTIEHCSWMDRDGKRGEYDPQVVNDMLEHSTWISPTVNTNWIGFIKRDPKRLALIKDQFKKMQAANIRFIASTDAGIPGVRHHDLGRALPVFGTYSDMAPIDVLRTATSNAAQALNINTLTGSISPGLESDLVFVEGDPLQDLSCLRKPVKVIARGVVVDD